jgi:hypothetical protein
MGLQFARLIGVDFAIQFIGWLISAKFRTEKFYDLTGRRISTELIHLRMVYLGSLTFILLTYLSRNKARPTLRQNIQSSCVFIWALR